MVFSTVKTNRHAEKCVKRNQKCESVSMAPHSTAFDFKLMMCKSLLMKGLSLYSIKAIGRNANEVRCQNSLLNFSGSEDYSSITENSIFVICF